MILRKNCVFSVSKSIVSDSNEICKILAVTTKTFDLDFLDV